MIIPLPGRPLEFHTWQSRGGRSRSSADPVPHRPHTEMYKKRTRAPTSAPRQFVDRLRPILFEQARQRAVGEELTVGLAARTIVGLVVGVADTLDGRAADGARFSKFSVHGHFVAEGGDLRREIASRLRSQTIGPFDKYSARRVEKTSNLFFVETPGVLDRRQPGAMKDLIRVGVPDAAEQARIGKRSLESVILLNQALGELGSSSVQNFEAAPLELFQRFRAAHQPQRCSPLGACLGQNEGAVWEIERGETDFAWNLAAARHPAQAPGDHQMDH